MHVFPAQNGSKGVTSYNDLTDKPQLFSGDYADISNKPINLVTNDQIQVSYAGNVVPVVLIFGQSNADGRGNTADMPGLDVNFPNAEVRIWNKAITRNPSSTSVNRVDNGQWKDYALGDMVVSPKGSAATAFGPELPIALRWRDELYGQVGKQLHIIKLAVGSTSLGANSSIDNNWSNKQDSLRQLAREYMVMPAIRQLQFEGKAPVCIGMIWCQGESDANSSQAPYYLKNLRKFIPSFRQEIGFPNCRTIIAGLSKKYDDSDGSIVKQAQIDFVAEDASTVLVRWNRWESKSGVLP